MHLFQCFSFDRKMINKTKLLLHSSLDLLILPAPNENKLNTIMYMTVRRTIKSLFKALFIRIVNQQEK